MLLRRDVDVFATFEGDNYVLLQLLAKDLLTKYAKEVSGLDPVGLAMFVADSFVDTVQGTNGGRPTDPTAHRCPTGARATTTTCWTAART